jgi:hypothetical protein
MEPTHPPLQCVTWTLSLGVKGKGREADHTPQSSAKIKQGLSLHSVVFI